MSTTGLCTVCDAADADQICDRCGSLVCENHFDESVGYCTVCARELGRGGDEESDGHDDAPDGVDTYRF